MASRVWSRGSPLFDSSQRNCPHLGPSIAAGEQTERGAIAEEEEQKEVEERRGGGAGCCQRLLVPVSTVTTSILIN